MEVLVGSRGTIGSVIVNSANFDLTFNSDNVENMRGLEIDTLICAAPSGNRLAANNKEIDDTNSVNHLISVLDSCSIKRLVLISTIDIFVNPETLYSRNRSKLESYVKSNYKHHILRLGTLIGKNIKKNILFDLTHDQFLDSIDPLSMHQYSLLDDVYNQILQSIEQEIDEISIISEPIQNSEILSTFFPNLNLTSNNTKTLYDVKPYFYNRQQVFKAIKEYVSFLDD